MQNSKMVLGVAVLLLLPLAGQAQQPAPGASSPMTLTGDDYAQIYQLYARYAYAAGCTSRSS